ncbi:Proteasome subunit alpha type-3 [Perkinsus olseni]|uniref:Proteasome subunit alpha type n=1 Tax=Perkinsus olseni TaxID=32597 RepID=A0A7J6PA09_PEROL|nr:Proteasome subunit alpha type-3 [Perkinsus olseni]
MSGTGSGYDLSATTYSPDGRVFQIEYAQKAVDNGGTALALCCKDGIVFANEKFLLSKMLVPGTNKRIFPVDRHATLAISGLVADAKQIVERVQASIFYSRYPGPVLADRVAMFMHMYTLYWSVRPFGSTVLLGVYDEVEGPQLYGIDPSGTAIKFKGIAVGTSIFYLVIDSLQHPRIHQGRVARPGALKLRNFCQPTQRCLM